MNLRRAFTSAVVPLLLTSCTADPDPQESGQGFEVNVDVDTSDLRTAKEEAGVQTCRPGKGVTQSEDGLPDVVLPCLGGGPDVNLSSLTGPMVINLWAQWCAPCREELPFYQQLHESAGDDVSVLGVDYQDTQPGLALELIRETGVTYPLLADPGAKLRVPFRVRGLPGAVFVARDGTVTHVEYAVIRSYGQLQGLVEQHLGVTVP